MHNRPRQTCTAHTRRPALSRRGLTLLEILLAVVMLVLVTTSITAAISSITAMEARSRKRVAACELANRIILQHLDEKGSVPEESKPLEYGKDRYFYELARGQSRMEINRKQERAGANVQGLARYRVVRVAVFEADEQGDYPVKGDHLATIERIYDPATARNPDSMEKTDVEGLIEDVFGGGVGVPRPSTGGAR